MKNVLYYTLCIAILSLLSSNSAFAQDVRSSREQGVKQSLESRYNMSSEQLAKFNTLKELRRQQITKANKSTKPAKERNAIIANIKLNFNNQVGTILSKEQYSLWQQDLKYIESLSSQADEIFNNYWYKQMGGRIDIGGDDMDYTIECQAKIKALLGEEEGRRKFNNMLKYKMTSADFIKNLNLPHNVALNFAQVKLWYIDARREARLGSSSEDVMELEILNINKKYIAKTKRILGPQKFMAWKHYQTTSFEREYKKRYSFTDEQLNAYKDIHNNMAIEILKIKKTRGTASEKRSNIEQIKAKMEEEIKGILAPDQYQKWINDRLLTKSRRKV